jgi:hypothetical protein
VAAGASGDDPFHPAASSAAAKSRGNNGSLSFGAALLAGVSALATGEFCGRAARAARSSAAVFGGAGLGRSERRKGAGCAGTRPACGRAESARAAPFGRPDAAGLAAVWDAAAGDGGASGRPV